MEESPNGLVSSQVPIIGWDMNSPQTTKISPRSVVLPRPVTETSSSPSGVYFIEQWGTHQRNKRRIKRPPKPNLYKRYDFTSALDTPEKSDSDFDDFSEEVLSQIRLTPLLNKKNSSSHSSAEKEVSPVEAGPSSSHVAPPVPQVFKTPTMFKTSNRSNHESAKVQPRKLTAEFDNAKSPVQFKLAQPNKQSNLSRVPQNNPTVSSSKPGLLNKPPDPAKPVPCNKSVDDEDIISSDEDMDVLRVAEQVYNASQSSQDSKVPERSKNKQPLKNQDRQQSVHPPPKSQNNIYPQSRQSNHKAPFDRPLTSVKKSPEKSSTSVKKSPEKSRSSCINENKENCAITGDGFSDDGFSDDSFDDLDIDEKVLESITAQNVKSKDLPSLMRTPPKVISPQHKKQKLSLSLKKNKPKT